MLDLKGHPEEPVKLARSLIWAPVCPVRTKCGPTGPTATQGLRCVPSSTSGMSSQILHVVGTFSPICLLGRKECPAPLYRAPKENRLRLERIRKSVLWAAGREAAS